MKFLVGVRTAILYELACFPIDEYTNKNKIEHNPNYPYIPDDPYKILIIGGSGSGKTNALLNLINNQPDIDKIYLYAKDPYKDKYQFLIKKRESIGLKHFNDMQTKTIEDYGKKQVEALENLKPIERSKAITYDDESLEQKQETYNKLFDEKLDEIQELSSEIDYKNLNYDFTTKASGSINFTTHKGPFIIFKKIRDGDISLEMAKDQKNLKENLVK